MKSHTGRFRVEYIDTDASGRIHFTAPFRWVETVEVDLYRQWEVLGENLALPRRHVEAEYIKTLGFGDEIEVELRVARVGTTSLTYEWDITKDGEVFLRGGLTAVQVDDEGRPLPIAGQLRKLLVEMTAAADS